MLTIQHSSHENIVAGAVNEGNMPQELHLCVLEALHRAGWVVLFSAPICLCTRPCIRMIAAELPDYRLTQWLLFTGAKSWIIDHRQDACQACTACNVMGPKAPSALHVCFARGPSVQSATCVEQAWLASCVNCEEYCRGHTLRLKMLTSLWPS